MPMEWLELAVPMAFVVIVVIGALWLCKEIDRMERDRVTAEWVEEMKRGPDPVAIELQRNSERRERGGGDGDEGQRG